MHAINPNPCGYKRPGLIAMRHMDIAAMLPEELLTATSPGASNVTSSAFCNHFLVGSAND
jgi:hypothetical protein